MSVAASLYEEHTLVEKEYSTARNKVRRMLRDAGTMEPYPRIQDFFRTSTTTPIEDDGVHADPIPGLRNEPIYVEQ